EEPCAALVDVRPAANPRLAHERQHDRGRPRPRRGAGVAHPAARELVAERAQQHVGIGGGHDGGIAPTVVLLHGFTHTGRSWDPVVAALGESYTAIAPDIRGHGAASDSEPVTLEAVIGDIGALAPERFTLAGYSMGGRIALHVALAIGARVERLVLIGASPGLAD